jgi:D-alanine-D-alanine ligase
VTSASARGFVPVLHAATDSRADEIDTLVAAEAVAGALRGLGFVTDIIGVDLDLRELEALQRRRPLLVFNLVDAVRGDGRVAPMIPSLLDALGLPYTGARTNAWLKTLSKITTKQNLSSQGLPTPPWSEDGCGLDPQARIVVKPIWEHGSLGMDESSVVAAADAAEAIAARNLRYKTEHFAESYIEGREFNAALMEGPDGVRVLPIAEIVFEALRAGRPHIVDYDAKWIPDSESYIGTPRRFGLEQNDPKLAARLREQALDCWTLFGLTGYARVDFRVDRASEPWILEVNVNPCLSPDAGFAAAAADAGLSYQDMIGRIVEASLRVLKATA